jgi:hypothetical protein
LGRETGNGKRETGNGKRETGNGKREYFEGHTYTHLPPNPTHRLPPSSQLTEDILSVTGNGNYSIRESSKTGNVRRHILYKRVFGKGTKSATGILGMALSGVLGQMGEPTGKGQKGLLVPCLHIIM